MEDLLSVLGLAQGGERRPGAASSSGFKLPSLSQVFSPEVLRPHVSRHLTQVYLCLFLAVSSAALGARLSFLGSFPSSPLLGLLSIAPVLYVSMTSPTGGQRDLWRYAAVLGAAFLSGAGVAPLIAYSFYMDPMLPLMALTTTALVFLTLTGVSLVARSRSLLFLGGVLGSLLNVLMVAGLVNLFWATELGYSLQLYGGLAVFSLYVILDTQVIISRASEARQEHLRWPSPVPLLDVPKDALRLWMDLFPIFVRILTILIQQQQRRERRERQRRAYKHY